MTDNTFISSFIAKLNTRIPFEYLEIINRTLVIHCNDYEISRAPQELAEYTGYLPECYQVYFVSRKIEGLSDGTLANYKMCLDDMFREINKPLDKITSNDLRIYLYKLQKTRNLTNRSLDTRRSSLMAFFSWAACEGYIPSNPMSAIKPIKYDTRKVQPLTELQLEMVRDACITPREKAIIEIMYATGCRVSELANLKIEDINFETGEVQLLGKGNKYRESYLSAKANICLLSYLNTRHDTDPHVIVSDRTPHQGISRRSLELVVEKIGARCGITGLHPHQIRHTTATILLSRGMDVTQLQTLLGHSSVETTMIYAKVANDAVKNNHNKYID